VSSKSIAVDTTYSGAWPSSMTISRAASDSASCSDCHCADIHSSLANGIGRRPIAAAFLSAASRFGEPSHHRRSDSASAGMAKKLFQLRVFFTSVAVQCVLRGRSSYAPLYVTFLHYRNSPTYRMISPFSSYNIVVFLY